MPLRDFREGQQQAAKPQRSSLQVPADLADASHDFCIQLPWAPSPKNFLVQLVNGKFFDALHIGDGISRFDHHAGQIQELKQQCLAQQAKIDELSKALEELKPSANRPDAARDHSAQDFLDNELNQGQGMDSSSDDHSRQSQTKFGRMRQDAKLVEFCKQFKKSVADLEKALENKLESGLHTSADGQQHYTPMEELNKHEKPAFHAVVDQLMEGIAVVTAALLGG